MAYIHPVYVPVFDEYLGAGIRGRPAVHRSGRSKVPRNMHVFKFRPLWFALEQGALGYSAFDQQYQGCGKLASDEGDSRITRAVKDTFSGQHHIHSMEGVYIKSPGMFTIE
eukprot:1179483-Prorocentrum_minimum.AAC.2